MSTNTTKRDIRHEMADVIALLDNEYTTTNVECDPGDTAIKITKQNSKKTLYIIAYSNPDDTETILYDEHDDLTAQFSLSNNAFNNLSPTKIADIITRSL